MAKDQSPIYTGGADADAKKEYSSFTNDSESRAWERSLYNIDKDQQQKERQRAWEDLDLLWHSVPGTADPLLKYDPLAGADPLRGYDPLRGSGSADNSSGTTSPDGADAVHSESEGAARSSNSARSTGAGRSASSNSARSRSTRAAKSSSASAKRYDNNARTGAGSTRRYDTNARTDSANGGSSKYGSYRNTTPANAGRSGSTTSGRSKSGAWGRSQSTTSGRSKSGSSSSKKKRTALDNAWDTIIGIMEMDGSPDGGYGTSSTGYNRSTSGNSRSTAAGSTAYRRNSSKTSVPNRKRTDTTASTSKFVSAMRSDKSNSGKKSPLSIILVVVAVFYVASMLFSFMVSQGLIDRNDIWPWQHTEGGGNSGGGSGGNNSSGGSGDNTDGGDDGGIFHGGDQSGQYSNPYPDGTVLTEFGFDYADFYTSKYICSYEDTSASSHKYQELCVVDNNELVGTADSPKNTDRLYSNHVDEMQYTLHYYLGGSYLPCGFTVQYADSVPSVNFYSAGTLYPPRTANQDDFFEAVLRELADLDDDDHKNLDHKKLNKFSIGEHDITYLEFTYEDSNGNKILDVISFEQKPLDCAFTAEYRCVQDDFDNAEAALEYLYGMLTFHTESFENVDASRHRFTSARVYNSKNTNSARIDLEDLGEPLYSEVIFKNTASFTYDGYNDYNDPSLRVSLDYIAYNVIDDHGGYENWISKTLEQAAPPNGRSSDVQETAREQFTFYAKKAYYLSYTGTEEIAKTTENVQYHKYLIETKEGGTLSLEVKYIHDIPEDFDPHKFLSRHLELKFAE